MNSPHDMSMYGSISNHPLNYMRKRLPAMVTVIALKKHNIWMLSKNRPFTKFQHPLDLLPLHNFNQKILYQISLQPYVY